MSILGDRAAAIAGMGLPVFPLTPGAKNPPLLAGWTRHATTDQATIKQWWAHSPNANIGIHCAGLVVVDVDVRSGGPQTLLKLELEGAILPPTLTTRTPTGGQHLFYRLPAGHPGVQNGAGRLGAGLDIKSTRGYVVGPGSVVAAGEYSFDASQPREPVAAPTWLLERIGTQIPKSTQSVDIPDAPAEFVERAREWIKSRPIGDEAYVTACGLRDRGLSMAQALEVLVEHDGRAESLLANKVGHAYEYAQGVPGSKVALPSDFDVVERAPEPPRKRPKVMTIDELAAEPYEGDRYLVKGLLSRGSHAVLYGAPGQGKTFVALDLGFHVAAGLDWHGRRVRQAPVLYLAYEGIGGMKARAKALAKHYEHVGAPLFIAAGSFNLREQAGRHELRDLIAELPEKPGLIVIDTLARAMMGGDENSAQDIGALNAAVTAMIEATGATVLLVHHSGKDATKGARGSSALLGAVDTEIMVSENTIQATKQRDVELGGPIGFALKPVTVGVDADLEPITSCVVVSASITGSSTSGLKGNIRRTWEVLCDLTGPGNKPIPEEEWRTACKEFLTTRTAFYDAKKTILRKRLAVMSKAGEWTRAAIEVEEGDA